MTISDIPLATDYECSVDVIGVGFGPSNLSIAIAMKELCPQKTTLFFEMQKSFGWHKGLLLDGATMQVSFLKDLVSQRNPRSWFTYTSFLLETGRLSDFINLKTFFPSRIEFHSYLEWCAQYFTDCVRYSHTVESIGLCHCPDTGKLLFAVETSNEGRRRRYIAGNILFGAGLYPQIPKNLSINDGVSHASTLRSKASSIAAGSRLLVVGGGQSAVESVSFLYDNIPEATIYAVFPRFGYIPADDSPFVNQLFDPENVELFFQMPSANRKKIVENHASTNYGVADLGDIESLYRRWYHERWTNGHRLQFIRNSRLLDVTKAQTGLNAVIRDDLSGSTSVVSVDAVVCATGYVPKDVRDLLDAKTSGQLQTDERGDIIFDRDYRALFTTHNAPQLFAPDMCERTHGLSATLISNMAVRAGEIARRLDDQDRSPANNGSTLKHCS